MPKGSPPKKVDPKLPRMFTWRTNGSLYNRLVDVVVKLDISINEFITKALAKAIKEHENDTSD